MISTPTSATHTHLSASAAYGAISTWERMEDMLQRTWHEMVLSTIAATYQFPSWHCSHIRINYCAHCNKRMSIVSHLISIISSGNVLSSEQSSLSTHSFCFDKQYDTSLTHTHTSIQHLWTIESIWIVAKCVVMFKWVDVRCFQPFQSISVLSQSKQRI